MKKRAAVLLLLICLLLCGVAFAETAYVNGFTADRVHLRSMPDQDSASQGLFYTGTQAEIQSISMDGQWAMVQIGESKGYMMLEYLQEEWLPAEGMRAELKTQTLNMRRLPGKGTNVIKVLDHSDEVVVLGHIANGWYYIQTGYLTGYVMEEYLVLTEKTTGSHNANIRKVGETFDGYCIYSWPAPNGQMLYFTGREDPGIVFEDVNFDGHEDVVISIIRGASNFFSEFFVWDNDQYVRASHDGLDYGLCNFHLYPEYGIVHSDANNGSAGAEHEDVLLRWEGTDLKTIRRAVSETHSETTRLSDGNGYTTVYDLQNLRVRVWDYSKGVYEGELIYDELVSLQQINDNDSYTRAFAGEQEALWRGIK